MFKNFIYNQPISNINTLKQWLITYKLHRKILFIKIPVNPPPTPTREPSTWDNLVINTKYFNNLPSSALSSASSLSSGELTRAMGSPYSKLPFQNYNSF